MDLGLVLDLFGAIGIAQRADGFLKVDVGGRDSTDHDGLCVASQRVLQDARQLCVCVCVCECAGVCMARVCASPLRRASASRGVAAKISREEGGAKSNPARIGHVHARASEQETGEKVVVREGHGNQRGDGAIAPGRARERTWLREGGTVRTSARARQRAHTREEGKPESEGG